MDFISNNPVTALRIFAQSDLLLAQTSLGLGNSAHSAGLTLQLAEELATRAMDYTDTEEFDAPDLVLAVQQYVAPGQSLDKLTLDKVVRSAGIRRLEGRIDRDGFAPPIPRDQYLSIIKEIEALVSSLRLDAPQRVIPEAHILANDLEAHLLILLRTGLDRNVCLVTGGIAAASVGSLLSYSLRWQLDGTSGLARAVVNTGLGIAGLFFVPAGAAGLALGAAPFAYRVFRRFTLDRGDDLPENHADYPGEP